MRDKLKKDFAYSMVVPTSMGVRLTPIDRQPVHMSTDFKLYATSAETNVASISASLGLPVKVLTTFVKDSPIAEFIRRDLLARHMTYEGKEVEPDGPWGCRHQINIADSGFGSRGPRVYNDRAGEVGRTLNIKDFDVERIFGQEGVQILHISGLIAALSHETGVFCLELAEAAKRHGTLISFDLNFRASFWENREEELRDVFTRIAKASDILIGNEEDYQLSLGIEGPKEGGSELADKIENFKEMIMNVKRAFPQTSVFANTLREVIDANNHLWGAILLNNDTWHVAHPRPISILDRIGGGDGFVGGLLYGILRGWEPEKWVQFGWATGVLATTTFTDYALPIDEEQVWSIWQGNARVKR
ncbi:MAG: PfkB family carbohydrate kinase [Christensenellales bacterium]|jgi:2-dehydro-3-deoxygluconokinase